MSCLRDMMYDIYNYIISVFRKSSTIFPKIIFNHNRVHFFINLIHSVTLICLFISILQLLLNNIRKIIPIKKKCSLSFINILFILSQTKFSNFHNPTQSNVAKVYHRRIFFPYIFEQYIHQLSVQSHLVEIIIISKLLGIVN